MPRSDRGKGTGALSEHTNGFALSFALNLCAALLIIILIFLPSPFNRDLIYENGKTYYEHYEANCRKAEGLRLTILRSLGQASTEQEQAAAEGKKAANEADITRECDMAAQYLAAESAASMDGASWVTMIATVIGAILVGFTLWFTGRTLREAKNTTKEAERSANAAILTTRISQTGQRPWLEVELSQVKGLLNPEGKIIIFADLIVQNHGPTPAFKVLALADGYCRGHEDLGISFAPAVELLAARLKDPFTDECGATIFPNQTISMVAVVQLNEEAQIFRQDGLQAAIAIAISYRWEGNVGISRTTCVVKGATPLTNKTAFSHPGVQMNFMSAGDDVVV